MRRPEWLTRESERWEADAIITPEQRRAILDRYPDTGIEHLTSLTLIWLAWLVAGFGLILLVSWNWTQMPVALKLGGTIATTLVLYGMAWRAAKQGAHRRSELLSFAGALALGAVTAAVTEWLGLARTNTLPLLFWSLGIAVTALVSASPIITAFGAGVLFFWALTDTGRPPAPWAFMLVFPILALATERRTQVYAAGALSVAFGLWAGLIGLDTWRSSSIPGMMLVAAGSAIDVWAHQPERRRPAFARMTPALAIVVTGLAFQGASALQGGGPPALWGDPAVSLPGLVLLVSLALVSLWPSSAQQQARWRPIVCSGLLLAWAASSVAASGRTPVAAWWSWMWITLPSVALVAVAVSAVREGAASRSRGLFVVGVLAMVALVVMHFTAASNRFGRSAFVLFAAAGVLWWISRARFIVQRDE
jgi:uncharacterized membrane protein